MDPIEKLMCEHRLIERVLDALEGWVDEVITAELDGRARLGEFADFIRSFADRWHHGKEEDLLFVAMVDAGFPGEAGPIAVMLHEHDLGRALVQKLTALAEQPRPWDHDARGALREVAYSFSNLLRDHIQKEDEVLYPMAQARVGDEVMNNLARQFQSADDDGRERARLGELASALLGEPTELP